MGTSSAPSRSASRVTNSGGRDRLTSSRSRGMAGVPGEQVAGGQRRFAVLSGAQYAVLGRQRHGTGRQLAALPERHVHGPVGPARLAVLPGAIERIDDPHPSAASLAGSSAPSSDSTASSGRRRASSATRNSCDSDRRCGAGHRRRHRGRAAQGADGLPLRPVSRPDRHQTPSKTQWSVRRLRSARAGSCRSWASETRSARRQAPRHQRLDSVGARPRISGSSFRSAAEKSRSTKSAGSIRPGGRPMPIRTRW